MKKLSNADKEIIQQRPCPDTIDPTMGSTADECLRLFYYTFVRNLTPEFEPDYFVSGRAWDAAMGIVESNIHYHTDMHGKKWEMRDLSYEQRWRMALEAMNRVYDTCRCNFFSPLRTRENLMQLLELYMLEHQQNPYQIIDANISFRFPFEDFFLGGEIDRYMNWDKVGVVVNENKTTTYVIDQSKYDNYRQQFKLGQYANQVLHYFWAVSQVSEEVNGAVASIASLDIPKRASTQRQQFDQIWLYPTQAQVEDYLDVCRFRMATLRTAWQEWKWPKQGRHCSGPWGFRRCTYYDLCRLGIPLWKMEDEMIPWSKFVQARTWQPWAGDKGR